MPTVEGLDRKIEEMKGQIARYEERRKALIAKEREQQKKWRAGVTTAIGELVLREVGCDWNAIDLECLQAWLAERAEDAYGSVVAEGQDAAGAKRALDRFKKAQKKARTNGDAPSDAPSAFETEAAEPQDAGTDMSQTQGVW